MRLHLDTSVLIDWHRGDLRIAPLRDEILAGLHQISIDPVVKVEYFMATRVQSDKIAIFDSVMAISDWIVPTSEACRLAASWLAPMDEAMRRAHFNDALIAAIATLHGATLVTGDHRIGKVFPDVAVQEY